VQQLRETFAEAAHYRYAILGHDSIFNLDVIGFLKATGFEPNCSWLLNLGPTIRSIWKKCLRTKNWMKSGVAIYLIVSV
jgi:hypothetical protein